MRKFLDKIVVCVFLAMMGYMLVIIVQQEVYLSEIGQETSVAQERLNKATEMNNALKQEKENLDKPEYIEKIAREELGMTKPGEVPYISSDEPAEDTAENSPENK